MPPCAFGVPRTTLGFVRARAVRGWACVFARAVYARRLCSDARLVRTTGLQPADYYSLMWLALQRSTTAREAITTMDALTSQFGYASTGESFSISDKNEVWHMEFIGKGKGEKGRCPCLPQFVCLLPLLPPANRAPPSPGRHLRATPAHTLAAMPPRLPYFDNPCVLVVLAVFICLRVPNPGAVWVARRIPSGCVFCVLARARGPLVKGLWCWYPPPPPHTHTHTRARAHARTHTLSYYLPNLSPSSSCWPNHYEPSCPTHRVVL